MKKKTRLKVLDFLYHSLPPFIPLVATPPIILIERKTEKYYEVVPCSHTDIYKTSGAQRRTIGINIVYRVYTEEQP